MSDWRVKLRKWRAQGSLRYLAHHLGVTTKQVARYWDEGWIPGCHRTPKGHRRIRYDDATVERTKRAVQLAKTTNIAIRYHVESIIHQGSRISLKGCHKMRDVYDRLRAAGLDEREAKKVASRPRGGHAGSRATDLAGELFWRLTGTSQTEVNETNKLYANLPLESLLEPCPAKEFRARARDAWRMILAERKAIERWEALHRPLLPEERARRQRESDALRSLLRQPDYESFVAAWSKANELGWRIFEFDDRQFQRIKQNAEADSKRTRLHVAVFTLRHAQQRASATALAGVLGISRPALYRAFGKEKIREALKILKNDAQAIHETRNDLGTKGRKANRPG